MPMCWLLCWEGGRERDHGTLGLVCVAEGVARPSLLPCHCHQHTNSLLPPPFSPFCRSEDDYGIGGARRDTDAGGVSLDRGMTKASDDDIPLSSLDNGKSTEISTVNPVFVDE